MSSSTSTALASGLPFIAIGAGASDRPALFGKAGAMIAMRRAIGKKNLEDIFCSVKTTAQDAYVPLAGAGLLAKTACFALNLEPEPEAPIIIVHDITYSVWYSPRRLRPEVVSCESIDTEICNLLNEIFMVGLGCYDPPKTGEPEGFPGNLYLLFIADGARSMEKDGCVTLHPLPVPDQRLEMFRRLIEKVYGGKTFASRLLQSKKLVLHLAGSEADHSIAGIGEIISRFGVPKPSVYIVGTDTDFLPTICASFLGRRDLSGLPPVIGEVVTWIPEQEFEFGRVSITSMPRKTTSYPPTTLIVDTLIGTPGTSDAMLFFLAYSTILSDPAHTSQVRGDDDICRFVRELRKEMAAPAAQAVNVDEVDGMAADDGGTTSDSSSSDLDLGIGSLNIGGGGGSSNNIGDGSDGGSDSNSDSDSHSGSDSAGDGVEISRADLEFGQIAAFYFKKLKTETPAELPEWQQRVLKYAFDRK